MTAAQELDLAKGGSKSTTGVWKGGSGYIAKGLEFYVIGH